MVGGLAPVGGDALEAVADVAVIHMTLTDPHAVQGEQTERLLVGVGAVHIKRKGECLFQTDRRIAAVEDAEAAHDSIIVGKDGPG